MTRMRWFGLTFGIVMILAAFAVVVWQEQTLSNRVALAQGTTPTATPVVIVVTATPGATPTATSGGATPAPTQPSQESIGDTFWRNFAAKLGLNPDDVKAKALETRREMLDQAVRDGRITQAQADALKQNLDANRLIAPIYIGRGRSGVVPPAGRGLPGFKFGGGFGLDALEAVAGVLNITPADLVTQLSQGRSLADIASARNVDQARVKQAIIDASTAEIDRALQFGLISQAQATALKAQLTQENIDLTRTPFFFRFRSR